MTDMTRKDRSISLTCAETVRLQGQGRAWVITKTPVTGTCVGNHSSSRDMDVRGYNCRDGRSVFTEPLGSPPSLGLPQLRTATHPPDKSIIGTGTCTTFPSLACGGRQHQHGSFVCVYHEPPQPGSEKPIQRRHAWTEKS